VNPELAAAIRRRRQRERVAELVELKRTSPDAFRRYADLVRRACQATPPVPLLRPTEFLRDFLRRPERYPPDPASWEAKPNPSCPPGPSEGGR